jgi:hypothetical protein
MTEGEYFQASSLPIPLHHPLPEKRPQKFIIRSTRRTLCFERPTVCKSGNYKHGELSLLCYTLPSISDVLMMDKNKSNPSLSDDETLMKGLANIRDSSHSIGRMIFGAFLIFGVALCSAVGANRLRLAFAVWLAIVSAYFEKNKYRKFFALLFEYPNFQNEQELYSNYSINERPFAGEGFCKLFFARHKKLGCWVVLKTIIVKPDRIKTLLSRIHKLVSKVVRRIQGSPLARECRHILPILSVFRETVSHLSQHCNCRGSLY